MLCQCLSIHEKTEPDMRTTSNTRSQVGASLVGKGKFAEAEVDAIHSKAAVTAIAYVLANWQALCRYPEDGELSIDNNLLERSLRAQAVGRKNWLFVGSDNGGRTAVVLFTITASCKRHGIDPFRYLAGVLRQLPSTPTDRLAAR